MAAYTYETHDHDVVVIDAVLGIVKGDLGIRDGREHGWVVEILLPIKIAGKGAARETDKRRLILFERAAEAHRCDTLRRVPR